MARLVFFYTKRNEGSPFAEPPFALQIIAHGFHYQLGLVLQ